MRKLGILFSVALMGCVPGEGAVAYTVSTHGDFTVIGMFENLEESACHDIEFAGVTAFSLYQQWLLEGLPEPERIKKYLSITGFYVLNRRDFISYSGRGPVGSSSRDHSFLIWGKRRSMVFLDERYWESADTTYAAVLLAHELMHGLFDVIGYTEEDHPEPFDFQVWRHYWEDDPKWDESIFEYRLLQTIKNNLRFLGINNENKCIVE